MALMANRKSVMTLFTGASDVDSHRVRVVMSEKGITADVLEVEPGKLPEDLIDLNPYHSVPTLVDRDLVLYDAQIIMEYLDERFPHPPLMPVDPVSRARSRLMLYRMQRDWFPMLAAIENGTPSAAEQARKQLREALLVLVPLFSQKPFFLSDEFSLVDCAFIPILWRLPFYGIELPPTGKVINDYAKRLFARDAVRASLSEVEKDMR
jgi:RNA polymerase-associated protein